MTASLAALAEPLLHWYDENKRPFPWRDTGDAYVVWISETMLCQTRIEAVLKRFDGFIAAFPSVAALAAADLEEVRKAWQGLGYYRRAQLLHRAAQTVMAAHGGELPQDYKSLAALPGFGRYTAAAVASIAFRQPCAAVDGNVLRVLARYTADDTDVTLEKTKRAAERRLQAVIPPDRPGDFNQALVELGETVCLPNTEPLCPQCPLAALCAGHRQGIAAELPVRTRRAARRVEEYTVLLLRAGSRIALQKRPEHGLLAGMYQFPLVEGNLTQAAVAARFPGATVRPLGSGNHLFTHIEWRIQAYALELKAEADGYIWVSPAQLESEYAVPSAFKIIWKEVMS